MKRPTPRIGEREALACESLSAEVDAKDARYLVSESPLARKPNTAFEYVS